jgi:protein-tyrosine phosphatase
MIDIHCHLLPGLDDGAKDDATALECLRMAREDGIRTLVMTPHIAEGVFRPDLKEIRAAAERLGELCRQEGIEVDLRVGSDNYFCPDLLALLKEGKYVTINENGKYALIELPGRYLAEKVHEVFFQVRLAGYVPIITHPERNAALRFEVSFVDKLVRMGCLMQITAASLEGGFGEDAERTARMMLRRGLVHLIATDAHSASHRPPILSRAVKIASKLVGDSAARRMVEDAPAAVLEGADVPVDVPADKNASFPGRIWSLFRSKDRL